MERNEKKMKREGKENERKRQEMNGKKRGEFMVYRDRFIPGTWTGPFYPGTTVLRRIRETVSSLRLCVST